MLTLHSKRTVLLLFGQTNLLIQHLQRLSRWHRFRSSPGDRKNKATTVLDIHFHFIVFLFNAFFTYTLSEPQIHLPLLFMDPEGSTINFRTHLAGEKGESSVHNGGKIQEKLEKFLTYGARGGAYCTLI